MKPILEHLPKEAEESFVVREFEYSYFPTPWHYHPEFELVLVQESAGQRFIGDKISTFGPGNLVLLGPWLPHTYRNDEPYYQKDTPLKARSIVIHFLASSLGEHFLTMPECKKLRSLLEKSSRGIEITGLTSELVIKQLQELCRLHSLARWLKLVEILHLISLSNDTNYISGNSFSRHTNTGDRLGEVIDYCMQHFQQPITIKQMADKANMADNSFSRYFTQRTRKSFTSFLAEIRLGHATKLLKETQKTVLSIALECGFNNLSNFNRQFRNQYKCNPLEYRKQHLFEPL